MSVPRYHIADAGRLPSPSVVVFREYLEKNIAQMIAMAGTPERLRPHCKTHKTHEIVRMLLDRGVVRHKAATVREVQMCLEAGARDVLLAYQLVGPAVEQWADLAARWREARLASLTDCDAHIDLLARAARDRGVTLGAMLDVDTGLHRTGVPVGLEAERLYGRIATTPGLWPAGLHNYDAQHTPIPEPERRYPAIEETRRSVVELAERLAAAGHPVPEILCGGSPSFPGHAPEKAPIICSPGTLVFSDNTYGQFTDIGSRYTPAALVFGRAISRPSPVHITLDVGTKAIAADPPVGKRGLIIGLEDYETVIHNEEHWAMTSSKADEFAVGDHVLVIPGHVCPCINLHPYIHVIGPDGRLEERWEVVARQRAAIVGEVAVAVGAR